MGSIQALVQAGSRTVSSARLSGVRLRRARGLLAPITNTFWQAMRARFRTCKNRPGTIPRTASADPRYPRHHRVLLARNGKPLPEQLSQVLRPPPPRFPRRSRNDRGPRCRQSYVRRDGLAYELTSAGTITRLARQSCARSWHRRTFAPAMRNSIASWRPARASFSIPMRPYGGKHSRCLGMLGSASKPSAPERTRRLR